MCSEVDVPAVHYDSVNFDIASESVIVCAHALSTMLSL